MVYSYTLWRALSSSDKYADKSEKPSASENSLAGDLGAVIVSFEDFGSADWLAEGT